MKLPYGYVLVGEEITVHEEKVNAVRSIFEYCLAGASLGKIVDIALCEGYPPTGKFKWSGAAVDKLLANKKYVPIVGVKWYMDRRASEPGDRPAVLYFRTVFRRISPCNFYRTDL